MSKSVENRHQVCPPSFADENTAPTHAESKGSSSPPPTGLGAKSVFPKDTNAFAAMKRMAASKMAESKSTPGKNNTKGKSRSGGFGRLLVDVTNEQKSEQCDEDEKVAMDMQCDEALSMASQWMQVRV